MQGVITQENSSKVFAVCNKKIITKMFITPWRSWSHYYSDSPGPNVILSGVIIICGRSDFNYKNNLKMPWFNKVNRSVPVKNDLGNKPRICQTARSLLMVPATARQAGHNWNLD